MSGRKLQNTLIVTAALAAVVVTVHTTTDWFSKGSEKKPADRERCYGVSRAGKNDCATSSHSCAAQSSKDRDKEEWLMVPKGMCEKLVDGVKGDA